MQASDQISIISLLLFIFYIEPTVIAQEQLDPFVTSTTNGKVRYKTVYACDPRTLHIECEYGTRINLIRANYGRFSSKACNDQQAQSQVDTFSFVADRVSPITVRQECQDKQSCSLNATSTTLSGDRFPRARKYIQAHFQCVPINNSEQVLSSDDTSATESVNLPTTISSSATPTQLPALYEQTLVGLGGLSLSPGDSVSNSNIHSSQHGHKISHGQNLLHLAGGGGGGGGKTSTWLSRVAANPAYARIVQQYLLRNQQHKQWPLSRHRSSKPHHLDEFVAPAAAKSAPTIDFDGAESGASYGRVAHFPHELDQTRAESTGRTLDKLHTLDDSHQYHHHSSSQQPDLRLTNEIGARAPLVDSTSGVASELESNQIPLIETESDDSLLTSRQKPALPSPANSIRQRYVYGNVLLSPSQAKAAGGLGSMDTGEQPIDKLRKYNRLQHQSHRHHQDGPVSSSLDKSMETNVYGRVLVSPQSSSGSRHEKTADEINKEHQQQSSISAIEQQQQIQGVGSPSKQANDDDLLSLEAKTTSGSLNKPRDQLEPSQFGFGFGAFSGGASRSFGDQQRSLSQGDGDEIAAQQHAGSVAAFEGQNGDASAAGGNSAAVNPQSGDEFEGFWHSGPLAHVEASRQVRRESSAAYNEADNGNGNNHSGEPAASVLRLTTSSPDQVLVID